MVVTLAVPPPSPAHLARVIVTMTISVRTLLCAATTIVTSRVGCGTAKTTAVREDAHPATRARMLRDIASLALIVREMGFMSAINIVRMEHLMLNAFQTTRSPSIQQVMFAVPEGWTYY